MSDPNRLQFVDTNILVYAYDISAGPKRVRALELVGGLWQSMEGCLSIQVMQEFYVNVTRKISKPLTSETAAQILADLSTWHVHCPSAEDVLKAVRLHGEHRVSFWDAMILVSAASLGCQTLWSEDLNPGQVYGRITVRNPF